MGVAGEQNFGIGYEKQHKSRDGTTNK